MLWTNGSLTLYHGTVGPHARDILKNGISLAPCSLKTDFSKGFYTTRNLVQATHHANHRYKEMRDDHDRLGGGLDPEYAVVVELTAFLDGLGALDTLAFVQPTPDWVAFVSHCRLPSNGHKGFGRFYEAVYGPVATALGTAIEGWEQMSFHSPFAVSSSILTVVNDNHRGTPML
jgi:hypothetical protein